MDHGRIAAQGTPAQLKSAIGGNVLSVRLVNPSDVADASCALAELAAGDEVHVDAADAEIRLTVATPALSAEAVRRLDARRLEIASVEVQQPSLDEVFLALTGRAVEGKSTDTSLTREAA